MNRVFRLAGTAAMAALLAGGAAPAMARPHGGWQGGHGGWHRHHDGNGLGTFLLGAAIVGGVAVIADQASKNNAQRQQGGGDRGDGYGDDGYRGDGGGQSGGRPRGIEDQAADACSSAASEKYGARVESVDVVQPDGEGFRVEGIVGNGHRFQCGARDGRVDFVQVDDEASWSQGRGH